jgi:hypothetical protein
MRRQTLLLERGARVINPALKGGTLEIGLRTARRALENGFMRVRQGRLRNLIRVALENNRHWGLALPMNRAKTSAETIIRLVAELNDVRAQLGRVVKRFKECVDTETPVNLVRLTLEVSRAEELLEAADNH